jgi:hypothetical protein
MTSGSESSSKVASIVMPSMPFSLRTSPRSMADERDVDEGDALQHLVGPDPSSAVNRGNKGMATCRRSVTPVSFRRRSTRNVAGRSRGRRQPRLEDTSQRLGGAEPQRTAMTSRVSLVVSRSRRAASRRTRSTNRPGVSPTSAVKTRVKCRTLMAAAAARAGSAMITTGADSTNVCTARTVERSARGTHTGDANWVCPPGAVQEHHQPAGHGLCHLDTEVVLHEGQGQVDAGRDAGAGPELPVPM